MSIDVFQSILSAPASVNRRDVLMPRRVPAPSHRHAAPSGPWPFVDLDTEIDPSTPLPPAAPPCSHVKSECGACWSRYPQSLFPNWTPSQQSKSGITRAVGRKTVEECVIYRVDVGEDGLFEDRKALKMGLERVEEFWEVMQIKRPEGIRLRALFVENLSGPVLQMLGTKYKIEPFFFSSSLNWIPSRYQEDLRPNQSDHITITLTFIRTMQNPNTVLPSPSPSFTSTNANTKSEWGPVADQVIDTQAPLALRSSDCILLSDLLAIHTIRAPEGSTIISYHPTSEWCTTSAKQLYTRLRSAGQSVYWQKILARSPDPTFVLLCILWYALYAWDEALEALYSHICWLETRVISTDDLQLTRELHLVRAHLLHYESLLDNFRKSVVFVLESPHPGVLDAGAETEIATETEIRIGSGEDVGLMEKECGNLLSEIGRLENNRRMQDKRLKNVMNLAFSNVNIADSKQMHKLAEAARRDSGAIKLISYLTMIFLPSSCVAAIFGMNVKEFNPQGTSTLPRYVAIALPLTGITIWIIVALQMFGDGVRARDFEEKELGDGEGGVKRMWLKAGVWWPVMYLVRLFRKKRVQTRRASGSTRGVV